MIREVQYLDIGGGFDTRQTEGIFPESTQLGMLAKAIERITGDPIEFSDNYYLVNSPPLEEYASDILDALRKYIYPIFGSIDIYTEPGRIIANNAMHLLVRVEDVKSDNLVITGGGGVHMVGWQRFLFEYFVKINLSNPSPVERSITISGSLCTTYDTWGTTCYSGEIRRGDYILIPYQGALTFALAHPFIFPIPEVYTLI